MSLSTKALTRRVGRAALIAVLMSGAATAALAAPSDAKINAMQQQLDALSAQLAQMRSGASNDSQLAALQAQLADFATQLQEIKAAQTTAEADIITLKKPPVAVGLANGKPSLTSSDGRFSANIRAIVMMDAGKYFQKDNLPAAVTNRDLGEGANFRRARVGFDGKLVKDFEYNIVYDFGGSGAEEPGRLYEASITYSALKPLRIKLGAFEPNIGLAASVSTSQMPLMERPAAAEIARNVAAGDSRYAAQIGANGVLGDGDTGMAARWFASGAFTGSSIAAAQSFDEQTAFIGRVAIAPFSSTNWQAHLGGNIQYVTSPTDLGQAATPRYPVQLRDRPELRIDGGRLIDTGAIDASHVTVKGLEAGATVQNFLIEGEYFDYKIDRRITGAARPSDPSFNGWYVQGAWVLTGEPRPYNPTEARFDAPKPAYNFNPSAGAWGAFEIAARYSTVDLNYHDCGAGRPIPASPAACFDAVRGGEQTVTSLGVNWYLNPAMRVMLNYQHVEVDRFNAAGVQVGQTYNAVAARGQVAF